MQQAFEAGFPVDMICFSSAGKTIYAKVGEEGNFINTTALCSRQDLQAEDLCEDPLKTWRCTRSEKIL